MMRALRAAFFAAGLAVFGGGVMAQDTAKILTFADLDGWSDDNHQAALTAFLETCADLKAPEWAPICALANQQSNAKTFFELFFRPVIIGGDKPALFTGYYEPELNGSRRRTGKYQYPLYRLPPEAADGAWVSRREIEDGQLMAGRGLEIAWIDDPVDVFFLQIQGSGRVRFPDGSGLRVGYAGANGHKYQSIGAELVRRGVYEPHQVSAQVIKNWVRRNPLQGEELLRHNGSYVFFRKIKNLPVEKGPLGAMNRSVTTLRTLAVDPKFTPLGAPVWMEKAGIDPMARLMIAQDTGSAIKGAQRADIFYGTGAKAGQEAGKIRDPGRMVVLLPIEQAFAMSSEEQL